MPEQRLERVKIDQTVACTIQAFVEEAEPIFDIDLSGGHVYLV